MKKKSAVPLDNIVLEAKDVIENNAADIVKITKNSSFPKELTDRFVREKIPFYVEGYSVTTGQNAREYGIDLRTTQITRDTVTYPNGRDFGPYS